jgi:thiol-disulfide isomerase/thioredoxin
MNRNSPLTVMLAWLVCLVTACAPIQPVAVPSAAVPIADATPISSAPPAWVDTDLTDAVTGKSFKIDDYKGKVVLVDGIATWCPTCFKEAVELQKLHKIYGSQSDFVTVSLGLDLHEDESLLKAYALQLGFDWQFAIAPLAVQREFGNSYGALFLDPTLSPMFIVDRQGHIYTLPFGYKVAEGLKKALDPFINAGS